MKLCTIEMPKVDLNKPLEAMKGNDDLTKNG